MENKNVEFQIELNSKVVEMIASTNQQVADLRKEAKPILDKIEALIQNLNNVTTAICFQSGVDGTKHSISFSEDLTKINVHNLEQKMSKPKTIKKKM